LRKNCIFLVDFPQGTVGRHKAPKSKLPMSCTIVVVVVCSVFNGIEKRSDEDLGRKFKKTFNCQPLSHRATEPHKLRTRVYERRVSFFLRNANRGYRKIAPNECNNSKNTFIKWQLSALGRCSRSPRNWVSRRSQSEANTSPPLCL